MGSLGVAQYVSVCKSCIRTVLFITWHGMQHLQWTTNFLSTACVLDNVVQAITLAKKR